MSRQGADPEALDALAAQMAVVALALESARGRLGGGLYRLSWSGADAGSFEGRWRWSDAPDLAATASDLRDAATQLRRQAQDQRETSADRGGPSRRTGTIGRGTFGLPLHRLPGGIRPLLPQHLSPFGPLPHGDLPTVLPPWWPQVRPLPETWTVPDYHRDLWNWWPDARDWERSYGSFLDLLGQGAKFGAFPAVLLAGGAAAKDLPFLTWAARGSVVRGAGTLLALGAATIDGIFEAADQFYDDARSDMGMGERGARVATRFVGETAVEGGGGIVGGGMGFKAGATLGFVLGGPVGAAAGATLGAVAGGAIGSTVGSWIDDVGGEALDETFADVGSMLYHGADVGMDLLRGDFDGAVDAAGELAGSTAEAVTGVVEVGGNLARSAGRTASSVIGAAVGAVSNVGGAIAKVLPW